MRNVIHNIGLQYFVCNTDVFKQITLKQQKLERIDGKPDSVRRSNWRRTRKHSAEKGVSSDSSNSEIKEG